MSAVTFGFGLIWKGKAELLAAAIVVLARVEAHQVGRCRLNMWIKDGDILQLIQTVSDDLVIKVLGF